MLHSDRKPFHHLIVSYESHLWKRILLQYFSNQNVIFLNSADLLFYSHQINLISLEGKVVVLTVSPFMSA